MFTPAPRYPCAQAAGKLCRSIALRRRGEGPDPEDERVSLGYTATEVGSRGIRGESEVRPASAGKREAALPSITGPDSGFVAPRLPAAKCAGRTKRATMAMTNVTEARDSAPLSPVVAIGPFLFGFCGTPSDVWRVAGSPTSAPNISYSPGDSRRAIKTNSMARVFSGGGGECGSR